MKTGLLRSPKTEPQPRSGAHRLLDENGSDLTHRPLRFVVILQAVSRGSPAANEEAEPSQQSTSFDEADGAEEEIVAQLQDVGVHERRQPSQYPPLTPKQRILYRDATDVSHQSCPAVHTRPRWRQGSNQMQNEEVFDCCRGWPTRTRSCT